MKGKLITFEGIEGCGKTTQMDLVCRELEERNRAFVRTREPGGTRIGREIRKILLDPGQNDLAAMAELLLYLADRAQHVAERIRPALEQGRMVLCDRFADATLAYQGYGRGLDRSQILEMNRIATGGLEPDLTLLIDLPVETGLSRARSRDRDRGVSGSEGRFEAEGPDFHSKVREAYRHLAELEPERFRVVDGSKSVDETHRQILSCLDPLL